MISKNKFRAYTVYCDYCGDFFDTNEDIPHDAWLEAKAQGWHRTFNEEYLCHYCPDCWEKRYQ